MYSTIVKTIRADQVMHYQLLRENSILSFRDVLALWQSDSQFQSFFSETMAGSTFSAFRWETPALSRKLVDRPFEYVLVNCPGFCDRATDRKCYADYFTTDEKDAGVVAFKNLSGTAKLIVPSPRTDANAYGHLAAFVRLAPADQRQSLWSVVGREVEAELSDKPIWLSTAGGGVAWLHVRIDSHPKYYAYAPFKSRA